MMDDFDAILNVQALITLEEEGDIPANPAEAIALAERVRNPIPEGTEFQRTEPEPVEASAALAMIHPEPEPEPDFDMGPATYEPEPVTSRAEVVPLAPVVARQEQLPPPVVAPVPSPVPAQEEAYLPEDVDTDFFAAALPEFTTEFDDPDDWPTEAVPVEEVPTEEAAAEPGTSFTWPLGPGLKATLSFTGSDVRRAHLDALGQYLEVFWENLPE